MGAVQSVECGGQGLRGHCCALSVVGDLDCWGDSYSDNTDGQLATSNIDANLDVIDFTTMQRTTCALLSDSTVKCFGFWDGSWTYDVSSNWHIARGTNCVYDDNLQLQCMLSLF